MQHPQSVYKQGVEFPPTTPGVLRVYSMRHCPYAERARLLLAHRNIKYETINIDLSAKPDWFLQRTALGTVPVLEKDGEIIVESLLCNDWIDIEYPGDDLIPDAKTAIRWKVLLALYEPKVVRPYYKLLRNPEDESLRKEIINGFKWLEEQLGDKIYFAGEKVGTIDFNLWPWFERFFAAKVDFKRETPKLAEWMTAMRKLPAVQECEFPQGNHMAFFNMYKAKLTEGTPVNYDFDLPDVSERKL